MAMSSPSKGIHLMYFNRSTLTAIFCSFFALAFLGCATVPGIALVNRQHLLKLSMGMDKKEALRIMGKKTVSVSDGLDGKVINNPYISEILKWKDRTFEVIYYLTSDRDIDTNTAITKDDLTPLVFDDGKLVGWGKDFLGTIAENHVITLPVEKVEKQSSGKKKKKQFLGGIGLGGVGGK